MSEQTQAPKSNALPVGTAVLAFPGTRDGRAMVTTTRSEPWRLPAGDLVVLVEGYAGGIALSNIEVLPTTRSGPDAGATPKGDGGEGRG